MRQGIIPSLSQIAGLELTDNAYALACEDDSSASQTDAARAATTSDTWSGLVSTLNSGLPLWFDGHTTDRNGVSG